MQDRFKYRAWNIKNKIYHYNAETTYDGFGGTPVISKQTFYSLLNDDNYIVEQCTGLRDKNGKLIYEGDIVRVIEQCMTNTLDKNYPMLFNEKTAKFGFKHPDGHFFYFTNDDDFSYEIIGNIHENADLLENKYE